MTSNKLVNNKKEPQALQRDQVGNDGLSIPINPENRHYEEYLEMGR